MKSLFIGILSLGAMIMFSNTVIAEDTTVNFPQLGIECDYANCNIGSGSRSCQVIDNNGGMVTINGVSQGQCDMFQGKIIIWENSSKSIKAKVVKSTEVKKW